MGGIGRVRCTVKKREWASREDRASPLCTSPWKLFSLESRLNWALAGVRTLFLQTKRQGRGPWVPLRGSSVQYGKSLGLGSVSPQFKFCLWLLSLVSLLTKWGLLSQFSRVIMKNKLKIPCKVSSKFVVLQWMLVSLLCFPDFLGTLYKFVQIA